MKNFLIFQKVQKYHETHLNSRNYQVQNEDYKNKPENAS